MPFLLFTYYTIKFAPLLERKPAKISCERKTMKWATKLAIKRKAKGKRREREKTRNKFEKKVQILTYAQINGKAGNYVQAENYVLSLGNFFFSHTNTNWPKNSSNRRIWAKMSFFCW